MDVSGNEKSYMSVKVFADTNLLVYAYDNSEPVKQTRALNILHQLTINYLGVISTQVLAEFFVTITRKIVSPIPIPDAHRRIENYLQSWMVVDVTGMIVLEAVRGVRDYQFNFWDAQIWAAARLNQVPIVFSEDFKIGTTVEGVRFLNPFVDNFRLEDWLTE